MDQAHFLSILQKTLLLTLQLSAPVLLISMIVGLIISVFQSVTQIQESTLTFVPKIIAGILTLIVLMPWMMNTFIMQVNEMFEQIPALLR